MSGRASASTGISCIRWRPESTFEQFLKEKPEGDFCPELLACRKEIWEALHPYSLKLLCLSPAQFIHFGTTHELLKLVTEDIDNYEFLDWKRQVLGVEESEGANACSNSYIEKHTEIAESSYIEDSYIYDGSEVGENCVISAVTLRGEQIPADTVLHGLKQKDGRFVVRVYGVQDNPKVTLEDGGALPEQYLAGFSGKCGNAAGRPLGGRGRSALSLDREALSGL